MNIVLNSWTFFSTNEVFFLIFGNNVLNLWTSFIIIEQLDKFMNIFLNSAKKILIYIFLNKQKICRYCVHFLNIRIFFKIMKNFLISETIFEIMIFFWMTILWYFEPSFENYQLFRNLEHFEIYNYLRSEKMETENKRERKIQGASCSARGPAKPGARGTPPGGHAWVPVSASSGAQVAI